MPSGISAFLVAVASQTYGAAALVLQTTPDTLRRAPEIPSFESFVAKYRRSYRKSSTEYEMRRSLYDAQAKEARRLNAQASRSWTADVSFLWDWTEHEVAQLQGWAGGARPEAGGMNFLQEMPGCNNSTCLQRFPREVEYGNLNSLKTVFDQGPCGSCWAVAGARVLSAHTELHMNRSMNFSAQELVSCVPNPRHCGGDGGCRGATVELAYAWVMDHGLAEIRDVPYEAKELQCVAGAKRAQAVEGMPHGYSFPADVGARAFGMRGWARLPENKYAPLLQAVAERGPVGVAVATQRWGLYSHGIFVGCEKDTVITHVVALIGYGHDKELNLKFWTLQNSWGPDWGEHGNMRLLRHEGDKDYCGINNEPEKGSGCRGGPPNVTVCGMCGVLYDSVIPFF